MSTAYILAVEGNASNLNEYWSMDLFCDQLYNGGRFRALTVVDNFSRRCLSIRAGKSLKGSDVVQVMKTIIFGNGVLPKLIKVDNVSEFINKILDKGAFENKVELDFSRTGKSTNHLFIESF